MKTEVQKKEVLQVPEILTYEFFEQNRYTISEFENYESICNNGWIKLYTIPTRVYWHAQNELEHRVPDWKFHISVRHEDLKKAWNMLVGLFVKMKCRAGMKTVYLKESQNPQIGREITLYIVKYSEEFQRSAFANDFDLSFADEHSESFWTKMVASIQQLLSSHQINSNGLADGDLAIGKYVSLRNQAFVQSNEGSYIYPPNESGWNSLKQEPPFTIAKMIKEVRESEQDIQSDKKRPVFLIMAPFFVMAFFLWAGRRNQHTFGL